MNKIDIDVKLLMEMALVWGDEITAFSRCVFNEDAEGADFHLTNSYGMRFATKAKLDEISLYGAEGDARILALLDHHNPFISMTAAMQTIQYDKDRTMQMLEQLKNAPGVVGAWATFIIDKDVSHVNPNHIPGDAPALDSLPESTRSTRRQRTHVTRMKKLDRHINKLTGQAEAWGNELAAYDILVESGDEAGGEPHMTRADLHMSAIKQTLDEISDYGAEGEAKLLPVLDHVNPFIALVAATQSIHFAEDRTIKRLRQIKEMSGMVGAWASFILLEYVDRVSLDDLKDEDLAKTLRPTMTGTAH